MLHICAALEFCDLNIRRYSFFSLIRVTPVSVSIVSQRVHPTDEQLTASVSKLLRENGRQTLLQLAAECGVRPGPNNLKVRSRVFELVKYLFILFLCHIGV